MNKPTQDEEIAQQANTMLKQYRNALVDMCRSEVMQEAKQYWDREEWQLGDALQKVSERLKTLKV